MSYRVEEIESRLNPIRDLHDRTYLYASNIAIDEGKQQPAHPRPEEELRSIDAVGTLKNATFCSFILLPSGSRLYPVQPTEP